MESPPRADAPSATIAVGDRPALEVALAVLTFLADTYGAEVESADVRSATEGTLTVSFSADRLTLPRGVSAHSAP